MTLHDIQDDIRNQGMIQATTDLEEPPPKIQKHKMGTCAYCSVLIDARYKHCGTCRPIYQRHLRKTRAQTQRLCELAKQRRAMSDKAQCET